jgi:hypothetical protein
VRGLAPRAQLGQRLLLCLLQQLGRGLAECWPLRLQVPSLRASRYSRALAPSSSRGPPPGAARALGSCMRC